MAVENIPGSSETKLETNASGPDAKHDTGYAGSRLRESRFWNAVAGMVVAVAIACGAVSMEIASDASHRAANLRRRLDRMQERVAQIESRLAESNRVLAEMQRQAEVRREFSRILSAPDGRLIRLVAVNPKLGQAGVVAIDHANAVFEMTGLTVPASDQHYSLRWLPHRGAPIATAEVAPPERGQAETVVRLPAPLANAGTIELNLESRDGRGQVVRVV